MDDPNTLKLTPAPDQKHHHRVFLYGFAVLLIISIAIGAGYLLGVKNVQPVSQPVVTPSTVAKPTPTIGTVIPTIDATVSANWKTYTDNRFKFSIKYPCYTQCQTMKSDIPIANTILQNDPQNTGYGIVQLQTTDPNATVGIDVISTNEITTLIQDALTPGPGGIIPYSIIERTNALLLPVGQKCQLESQIRPYTSCDIVTLNGKKAIKVSGIRDFGATGPTNTYIVSLGNGWWFEISEYATSFIKPVNDFKQQFSAADQIVNTLTFQ